jgi:hypothetical protein
LMVSVPSPPRIRSAWLPANMVSSFVLAVHRVGAVLAPERIVVAPAPTGCRCRGFNARARGTGIVSVREPDEFRITLSDARTQMPIAVLLSARRPASPRAATTAIPGRIEIGCSESRGRERL